LENRAINLSTDSITFQIIVVHAGRDTNPEPQGLGLTYFFIVFFKGLRFILG